MAEVFLDWFDEGLNVETTHLVGHSLGGQMCGVIGRSVYKKSRGETQISRISALDPAFPGFYPSLGTPAVNKNDAKFVDIIHTGDNLYNTIIINNIQCGTIIVKFIYLFIIFAARRRLALWNTN